MSRILIVDDEPPVREVLTVFLENRGYDAHAVEDGESALAWLESNRPDMVLLDVRMPGMNGLEVLREATRLHPDLPVIMISGYADEDIAREALNQGAYDFFLKPFDLGMVEMRLSTRLGLGGVGG
jgi:DNA-binding NtrC family response regulator